MEQFQPNDDSVAALLLRDFFHYAFQHLTYFCVKLGKEMKKQNKSKRRRRRNNEIFIK